jgi:putative addiction module killer protein
MSPTRYNSSIEKIYEVDRTEEFSKWLMSLKDEVAKGIIAARIERLGYGNLGDSDYVCDGLNEMRVHYGAGYRLYWFRTEKKFVLLAYGGNKSTQKRDIKKAKRIMNTYKKEQR